MENVPQEIRPSYENTVRPNLQAVFNLLLTRLSLIPPTLQYMYFLPRGDMFASDQTMLMNLFLYVDMF